MLVADFTPKALPNSPPPAVDVVVPKPLKPPNPPALVVVVPNPPNSEDCVVAGVLPKRPVPVPNPKLGVAPNRLGVEVVVAPKLDPNGAVDVAVPVPNNPVPGVEVGAPNNPPALDVVVPNSPVPVEAGVENKPVVPVCVPKREGLEVEPNKLLPVEAGVPKVEPNVGAAEVVAVPKPLPKVGATVAVGCPKLLAPKLGAVAPAAGVPNVLENPVCGC